MLTISWAASAQFVTTNDNSNNFATSSSTNTDMWESVRFAYVPSTISQHDEDVYDFTGFALEYLSSENIVDNMPVFFEGGFGFEYLTERDEESSGGDYVKTSTDIYSFYIPLNVGYKLDLQEGLSVMPFVGLKARFNIAATQSIDMNISGLGSMDETYSLFDEDEYDCTFKRFHLGWQVGADVIIGNLNLAVSYGSTFSEEVFNDAKDCAFTATTISVGFLF